MNNVLTASDETEVLRREVTLRFGECTLRFRSPDPTLRFQLTAAHVPFVVHDLEDVACDIQCERGDPTPGAGPPRFAAGASWELRRRDTGGEEVCFYTAVGLADRAPILRLDVEQGLRTVRAVRARLTGVEDGFPVGFPLDEYLASRLLMRMGAVVVHASVVADTVGALVFLGHSGAGKSTIAELGERAGGQILSDDRAILARRGGSVMAWGTPWHGTSKRGLAAAAPVRGVFLLRQAEADDVIPLEGARLFKEMLVRLIQPTVEREELVAAVATVEHVAAVPGAELRFRPTVAAYSAALRFAAEESGCAPVD